MAFKQIADLAEIRKQEAEQNAIRAADDDRIIVAFGNARDHFSLLSETERDFIRSAQSSYNTRRLSEAQKKWLFDIQTRLTTSSA